MSYVEIRRTLDSGVPTIIELALIDAGGEVGAVLPKRVVDALQTHRGDPLYLAETLDGSYRLARHDPETVQRMKRIEGEMHEDDA